MQTKAEMLNDDVVELERIFDDHASPALREIWTRLNADDRDVGLVSQAVKAALLRAYATGQMATDDGWYREKLQDAGFLAGDQWLPHQVAAIRHVTGVDNLALAVEPKLGKGPRPYHVRMRDPTPEQAARWEAMRKHLGTFVGVDVGRDGDKTVVTRAAMEHDGRIRILSVEEVDGEKSETGNAHVKEPCPVERMEDEGGPASGDRDWDQFPKVGLSKPVDIMAITRSLSGG